MSVLTAVVGLAAIAWLIGLQAVAVTSDSSSRRPDTVRLVTLLLGVATVVLVSPRLFQLLT